MEAAPTKENPVRRGIGKCTLAAAGSEEAEIADIKRLVHLQFHRFAGCA